MHARPRVDLEIVKFFTDEFAHAQKKILTYYFPPQIDPFIWLNKRSIATGQPLPEVPADAAAWVWIDELSSHFKSI